MSTGKWQSAGLSEVHSLSFDVVFGRPFAQPFDSAVLDDPNMPFWNPSRQHQVEKIDDEGNQYANWRMLKCAGGLYCLRITLLASADDAIVFRKSGAHDDSFTAVHQDSTCVNFTWSCTEQDCPLAAVTERQRQVVFRYREKGVIHVAIMLS